MAQRPGPRGRGEVVELAAARAEAERLARFRAGEAEAFDEILAEYWSRIVRYAERLLADRDLAHDVAQDAFLRLWLKRHEWTTSREYRGASGAEIGAFLYRAAHNLAIDENRKERTRKHGLVIREAQQHAQSHAHAPPTPDSELEQNELRDALEHAVAALPTRRREVFILFHLHGLSYRQIAEVLDLRPQVVANYMSAALAELRGRLRSLLPGHGPDSPTESTTLGG